MSPSVADLRSWLRLAVSPAVVRRALLYAVVVGPVLVAINHADAIARGDIDAVRLGKMALTVLVPYAVSTLSSVGALRARGGAENVAEPP